MVEQRQLSDRDPKQAVRHRPPNIVSVPETDRSAVVDRSRRETAAQRPKHMTEASTFERLNRLLKENHAAHAIAAVVVVFAVGMAYNLYTGVDLAPALLDAIFYAVLIGAIDYGVRKYYGSASESD